MNGVIKYLVIFNFFFLSLSTNFSFRFIHIFLNFILFLNFKILYWFSELASNVIAFIILNMYSFIGQAER